MRRAAKREAQALVIQRLVAADLAAGREVVITGDFNDFSGTDLDQQGNVPNSHVLQMLQDIDGNGEDELTNLVSLVPRAERYSDWWDHSEDTTANGFERAANGQDDGVGEHSQLDHMLVSAGLRARVKRVWIDHGHDPADVSDHWPVMAELRRSCLCPDGSTPLRANPPCTSGPPVGDDCAGARLEGPADAQGSATSTVLVVLLLVGVVAVAAAAALGRLPCQQSARAKAEESIYAGVDEEKPP